MACDACGGGNAAHILVNGKEFHFCGKASCWLEIKSAVGEAIASVRAAV